MSRLPLLAEDVWLVEIAIVTLSLVFVLFCNVVNNTLYGCHNTLCFSIPWCLVATTLEHFLQTNLFTGVLPESLVYRLRVNIFQ